MKLTKENLLIVIVLYKEKLNAAQSFSTIVKGNSTQDIYVYDNSPERDFDAEKYSFVTYFHDSSNAGVSTAYNKGAQHAQKEKKEWLLLLDQDTSIPPDFINNLILEVEKKQGYELYATRLLNHGKLLSPCGYKFKRGYQLDDLETGVQPIHDITFLNSGLLISLDLFTRVNGYDASVPLYFSDFVFVNKLRKLINAFVLLTIELHHNLSSNDMTDIRAFKIRYDLYLKGAFEAYRSEKSGLISYVLTTFFRAAKLSYTFKDGYYIISYFSNLKNIFKTLS